LETITEQNAEYSTQFDALTQEIQHLQSTLDHAREDIKMKDEELCENKKSATKLETDLKQRETELDNFKQRLNKEREISKTAKDARIAIEHDLMLLKRERSSLSERLQWLNQFAAELRKPDRDVMYVQSYKTM
jgi:chromosome segregation ATPase